MCAFRAKETLSLQKQLQQSAMKISHLQKQLDLANQRWRNTLHVINNEGMHITNSLGGQQSEPFSSPSPNTY